MATGRQNLQNMTRQDREILEAYREMSKRTRIPISQMINKALEWALPRFEKIAKTIEEKP